MKTLRFYVQTAINLQRKCLWTQDWRNIDNISIDFIWLNVQVEYLIQTILYHFKWDMALWKLPRCPPVHASNMVANGGNTTYEVDVIQTGFMESWTECFYSQPFNCQEMIPYQLVLNDAVPKYPFILNVPLSLLSRTVCLQYIRNSSHVIFSEQNIGLYLCEMTCERVVIEVIPGVSFTNMHWFKS